MGDEAMTTLDAVERWHRQHKRDKRGPKPKRCSSPLCTSGYPAAPDGVYCLDCHQRLLDRSDMLRIRAEARE
jgi:hypothetical protein